MDKSKDRIIFYKKLQLSEIITNDFNTTINTNDIVFKHNDAPYMTFDYTNDVINFSKLTNLNISGGGYSDAQIDTFLAGKANTTDLNNYVLLSSTDQYISGQIIITETKEHQLTLLDDGYNNQMRFHQGNRIQTYSVPAGSPSHLYLNASSNHNVVVGSGTAALIVNGVGDGVSQFIVFGRSQLAGAIHSHTLDTIADTDFNFRQNNVACLLNLSSNRRHHPSCQTVSSKC